MGKRINIVKRPRKNDLFEARYIAVLRAREDRALPDREVWDVLVAIGDAMSIKELHIFEKDGTITVSKSGGKWSCWTQPELGPDGRDTGRIKTHLRFYEKPPEDYVIIGEDDDEISKDKYIVET